MEEKPYDIAECSGLHPRALIMARGVSASAAVLPPPPPPPSCCCALPPSCRGCHPSHHLPSTLLPLQPFQAHKAGRTAGKSAREKHRAKKEAGGPAHHRTSIKATSAATKAERALQSKQSRDAKRQQALEARRRREGAPLVVALLPLSDEADAGALWARLHEAVAAAAAGAPGGGQQQQQQHGGKQQHDDAAMMDVEASAAAPADMRPHTVTVQARTRLRLTLLPPPRDRGDPLAYVDLGRAADVLLLLVPGSERALAVDAEGALAMRVLRAMGLPTCVGVVACGGGAGSGAAAAASMKERSAAKKRAEKALAAHLPGGELRLLHGDSAADAGQLLRHLGDAAPRAPLWRRSRAAVMVQEAAFALDPPVANGDQQQQQQQQQPSGTLRLTGYVRGAGLSANQLVTLPGAGDFRLLAIEGPRDPAAAGGAAARRAAGGGDAEMADGAAAAAAVAVLAVPDPEQQDDLTRENAPDPMAGEQTWPTDEELRDAELAAAKAAAARARRRRRLPAGTSDYQAAWIFEDMSGGESDEEEGEEGRSGSEEDGMEDAEQEDGGGDGGDGKQQRRQQKGGGGGALQFDELGADADLDHLAEDDPGTDGMMLLDEGDDDDEDAAATRARLRAEREEERARRRAAEADDVDFPDEVEVPDDKPARERFARYRGLKSLRSSPWDPREGTPAEYERVFAFENFKRTHKRAKEAAVRVLALLLVLVSVLCCFGCRWTSRHACQRCLPYARRLTTPHPNQRNTKHPTHKQARATAGTDPCAVPPGSYVTLVLAAVPAAAAARALERAAAFAAGAAPPLTAFGLMQHECKLSVVNFSLKKAPEYAAPIRNKEPLLFVTGLRAFEARPVLSGDDTGADKHKMERFLHDGRHCVASVYAPICYGPLPLLAFKVGGGEGGGVSMRPALAAVGSLRGVDPDRVVLKKIVLTGYPARWVFPVLGFPVLGRLRGGGGGAGQEG